MDVVGTGSGVGSVAVLTARLERDSSHSEIEEGLFLEAKL